MLCFEKSTSHGRRLVVAAAALLLAILVCCCQGRKVKQTKQQQQTVEPVYPDEQPIKVLSNGFPFPLVGMGVGNLQHDLIESVVTKAVSQDGYRVIDTAKASNNERQIAQAIEQGMKGVKKPNNVVNVVTKIWYTHLGYERTRLSVQESLEALLLPSSKVDIRVHMLIHWPRCDDNIEWMNCEQEEADLPQYVKDAGPPPHLHKDTAWKESWKALEDMYNDPTMPIASIGVSNFNLQEMQDLCATARIKPHMHQGYVWSGIHDPRLMRYLYDEDILYQTYSVMHSVAARHDAAPNAYARLTHIGGHVMDDFADYQEFSAAQVVLAWFVQNHVSVIPRASSPDHQTANSPKVIAKVPRFTKRVDDVIHQAVSALLRGEDMGDPQVQVYFTNTHNEPVNMWWHNRHTGEEVQIARDVQPGQSVHQQTWPEHMFIVVSHGSNIRKNIRITANFGDSQEIRIDLSQPKAKFTSADSTGPVHLYWSSHDGEELPVKEHLKPGDSWETNTHPGHVFVAYDKKKKKRKEFKVDANYGDQQHFHIDL